MKRVISIFLFLLGFSCFADEQTQEEFERIKEETISELTAVGNSMSHIGNDLFHIYDGALREYQDILNWQATNPSDSNSGAASGAANIMAWVYGLQPIIQNVNYHQVSLNNAIQNIALLAWPTNKTVDLQPILDAIASNTTHIANSIYVSSDNITNSISYNTQLQLDRMNESISNIVVIIDILRNFNPSSGGGGGYDDSDLLEVLEFMTAYLEAIHYTVDDIYYDLNMYILTMTDANGIFQKYLKLAKARLELPDSSLSSDLAHMWQSCIDEMTNVVFSPDRYSLTSQVFPVVNDLSANGVRLSNEGLIGLQNLAFNQRQYLCSVQMLQELKGLNNTNNLSWITNYLATVQQPYFQLFNLTHYSNPTYYLSDPFTVFTNFLYSAMDSSVPISDKQSKFLSYVSSRTNWFDRIELQLMTLNGLFPLSADSVSEFEESVSDEENNQRLVDYSTNALASIVGTVSSSTGSVVNVFNLFGDLLNSFQLDDTGLAEGITIMPSIDMGGIQMEHVRLTYSTLEPFIDPMRTMFTCIWWVLGSVFSFRCFCALLRALGSLTNRIVQLLGISLS